MRKPGWYYEWLGRQRLAVERARETTPNKLDRGEGLLLLLLVGFDLTVGAIWGREAFGVVALLTAIGWVLTVRWTKR